MDGQDLAERFLRAVRSLYVLVKCAETATTCEEDATLRDAADECAGRLGDVLTTEPHLVIQERAGGLGLNGLQLRPGVESFVAVDSLAQLLRAWGISEVLLARGVGADDLRDFAVALSACEPAALDPEARETALASARRPAIQISTSADAAPAFLPRAPLATASGSMIRSMFVANRLVRALDSRGATVSDREILQSVVELLVCDDAVLRTVTLLERDPDLFARSVSASVHAVQLTRRLGGSRQYQAEIAVAALLHGIGTVLGPSSPDAGVVGMRHLLEVGLQHDILLRAALVARRLGERDAMGDAGAFSVALVAAAVALAHHGSGEADATAEIARQGRERGWPESLCAALDPPSRAVP